LIFALLQIWRPCYFLTDDNLSFVFPFLSEVGRHLLQGESPFVSHYLFGGDYDYLHDPTFLLWHPVYLLASLLTATPARFLIIDLLAFVFLMLTTAGFVNLVHFLRRELGLGLSDGWLMFYTMSFTYTFMVLATGASWVYYLGNYSALPWLVLGILQKSGRVGSGLVFLFSLHQFLGGCVEPLITISLFLTLFAGGIALWRRSAVPLVSWFAGYGVALVLLLPIFIPALHGFFGSHRSESLPIAQMQISRIPWPFFPVSYLFGTGVWLIQHPPDFHVYQSSLAACAAAWCLLPALLSRRKWHFMEAFMLGLAALTLVMIVRPVVISEVMSHLPLLRSVRMPFRELFLFHFFLHLFLVVRHPGWTQRPRQLLAGWSAAVFVLPLVLYAPPSFNPMKQERQLLFSGELERYWAQVKTNLQPEDRVAVIVPGIYLDSYTLHSNGEWAPFGLLGMHDFSCFLEFKNASGYSPTAPADQLYLQTPSFYLFGAFTPEQIPALWRERPDLKLMVLESLNPIKITLRSKNGPDIDLSPLIPRDVRYP
jgi:hypothetical protein